MDQTVLLLLCVCVGFISGYSVRALISEYRRRQALEAREGLSDGKLGVTGNESEAKSSSRMPFAGAGEFTGAF